MSIAGSVLLLLLTVGLLAGKIRHDYEPLIRAAERHQAILDRCQKWGSKCQIYACYRTDKGKFICQE